MAVAKSLYQITLPKADSTITIQQALLIAETLEHGKETSNKYIIIGIINDEDHPSPTDGATTITANGKQIYITEIKNADGSIGYKEFTTKLQNGDEITVSATSKPSIHYANAILEKWFAEGIKNIDDVNSMLEAREQEKVTDGKSFDVDDFFAAALKRSYSEE